MPVSVAINDNLTNEPVFIVDQDPGNLINSFIEDLKKRQRKIAEMVECLYPQPESDDDGKEKKEDPIWRSWVKQVPVFGFNSGRYDINMIKEYFVKNLAIISDVNVAKKENSYMFLSTPNFKFLDIQNYLAPGLSYDAWCRAYGCELQKLAFPYEWLDSFEKLNHIGPVKYEEFYSSLKGGITISQEEYQNFRDEFHKRGCETMKDWLKEYNLADVTPFIEALEKTREQYYPDEIDLLKDAVSIPGISMMYVLNEVLKRKKYSEPDLFAPGEPCKCVYLNHGLQVTNIHRYISYTSGRPFKWFPEEVSSARRAADQDKNKKQLGDTAKLKGNSFYGKMIENLEKHMNTKFTTNEKLIDEIFRSPFFEDLEEISNGAFEVSQRKRRVTITRPYQCGIAVYQLAKLRMLEFYYDFLDKFCDRRDFELIQMDTDSFYMALSAEDFDEIIKPEMKKLYFGDGAQLGSEAEKKNWLVTDEYSKRVPGLFKAEFQGKRMIALTSKCYYADSGGDEGIKKFSCKGVSRRQNEMNLGRYRKALFGSLDKARNIGFRKRDNHIVTYEQSKLGLSAYYDKRIVHEDGIHTSCL